jgi:hypothetical protein
MIDARNNFRTGLDLDSSPMMVAKTSYSDALNITRDAISGSADEIITNVVGNRIASYGSWPFGGAGGKITGMCPNTLRNTVVFFRYQSNGYHGIYEFNKTTRVITKIFQNLTDSNDVDILGFTASGKITSVNILNRDEGDLLFFLDSLGRPTKMDITLFKAGTYTPVTRSLIDVAITWPYNPITCGYSNDTNTISNNLTNKLFKFQYIWVNDDLTETCGSPESATPLPLNILNPTYTNVITNNNVISLTIPSGTKNVKSIKLLMSFSEKANSWQDFVLVDTIDKSARAITDNSTFTYSFYNDSTYPVYDIARRTQLFDYIPIYANAQELAYGNVPVYGGVTEGYNNTLSPNVTITINTLAVGSGTVVGNLSGIIVLFAIEPSSEVFRLTFSGVPGVGNVVNVYITPSGGAATLCGTYTTISGDTATTVATAIAASMNALGVVVSAASLGAIVDYRVGGHGNTSSLQIVSSGGAASTNSISTWPFLSPRKIGLVYFDNAGRTNGVVYSSSIIFPAYSENASHQVLVPYINAKIYHVPPDFAYSFSWVITHDSTQYLYFECVDVNTAESDYIYFDVTNLGINQRKNPTTAAVVAWSFQDGDRFRLIRRSSDGNVFGTTYDAAVEGIVVAPIINGVTQTGKTFVKIKKVAPFSTESFSSKFFVFQLYRPTQSQTNTDNLPFFEFGETYSILNPGTATRVHSGQVTNQSTNYVTPAEFNFYKGDSYLRPRTVYTNETATATFNVQDRNFIDTYISAVNSLDGRPNAIDPNARQAYYPSLYRYGQDYDPSTNLNKTNRFLPTNFGEVDAAYGAIRRFKARDKFIRVFQELKVGMIPLFNKIGKSSTGDDVTIVTDELFNPVNYYSGDYGIGTASESLASFNYADYFCDNNRGAICRISLGGIEVISVLYKVNSFAIEQVPLRTSSYKIYGAFDQQLNNYISALEATDTQPAYTLSFSEHSEQEYNSFESFLSYHPEMMCTLGTLLITASGGNIYTHDSTNYNTFYGTTYDSTITFVFNDNPYSKKTWVSVAQVASGVWDCPTIETNSYVYGTTKQQSNLIAQEFAVLEGMPSASFRRASNSRAGKINGDVLKGNYCIVKFRKSLPTDLVELSLVSVKNIVSQLNTV